MTDVLAGVALAAGAGTRLRPLTEHRPKALCPVDGVPLVGRTLDSLTPIVGSGRWHVAVNAHHFAQQVAEYVGDSAFVSREEPEALGTAGALGALRPWIDGRDVLVCNADAYLPGGVDALLDGWDRRRCRLLVRSVDGRGDFSDAHGPARYVGACVLPWRIVRDLRAVPTGLYEVLWRAEDAAGRLDLVRGGEHAIDCGTPADYLAANVHASGGCSVVGAGATVEGTIRRCVVWPGAHVGADERLVDCIRAGTREHPLTVDAAAHG